MQIGAHTVSHPILARTDIKTAQNEIISSKNMLEALLGENVNLFAYPNGKPGIDYSIEHPALVRELGFSAAASTAWGLRIQKAIYSNFDALRRGVKPV